MANINAPIGGKPFGTLVSSDYVEHTARYVIPASDVDDYFLNDFITNKGGADDDGIPIAIKTQPTEAITGIIVGFEPLASEQNYNYRRGSIKRYALVIEDPLLEIEIQANDAIIKTDIGKNANIILNGGDKITGLSKTELNTGTITTASAQLKILGLIERPDNELGDYAKLRCSVIADTSGGGVPIPNEDNIYYTGGHGADTVNDGRNIEDAFRTLTKGIDTAITQSPSETNQYVIRKIDAIQGQQFTLNGKEWIHIYAPNTSIISGTNVIGDNASVTFRTARFSSGAGILILKTGTGESFLDVDKLYHTTVDSPTFIQVTDGGTLFSNVRLIKKLTSGDIAIEVDDGTIYNNSQKIDGDIVVDDGETAKIVTHDLIGDVTVGIGARLDLFISGEWSSNLTVGANSLVNVWCSKKTGGSDSIDPTATYNCLFLAAGGSSFIGSNITFGQDVSIWDDLSIGGIGDGNDGQIRIYDGNGVVKFILVGKTTGTELTFNNRPTITDIAQGAADNDKLATQGYVDDTADIDQNQIYYVGKHGSDAYDGKNISKAFLTDAKALTEISGQTPSATNQFALHTNDAGIYTGSHSMGSITYTKINKPNAIIKADDGTINSDCSINVKEYYRSTGVGFVLNKTGTGKAFLKAEQLANTLGNNGGGITITDGELDAEIGVFTVALRTDTLITANPASSNKKIFFKGDRAIGKIFTTSITDQWHFDYQALDCDFSLNAASKLFFKADNWKGNIVAAGALAEIDMQYTTRLSDPLNDVIDPTVKVKKIAPPAIYHYTSNTTLKVTQSGDIITNKGATGNIDLTLPIANQYTEGLKFTICCVEDYQISIGAPGTAFRFIEANGSTTGAGLIYAIYKGTTVELVNMGEYGTYGYWYIYIKSGRISA